MAGGSVRSEMSARNTGSIFPCTYTYQLAPAWMNWPQQGTFLSEEFFEASTNSRFRHQFYCLLGFYLVRKAYSPGNLYPQGGVGPAIWRFLPNSRIGNVCSPFAMVSGNSLIGLASSLGVKVRA